MTVLCRPLGVMSQLSNGRLRCPRRVRTTIGGVVKLTLVIYTGNMLVGQWSYPASLAVRWLNIRLKLKATCSSTKVGPTMVVTTTFMF